VRSLLVVRLDNAGDVLLLSPALGALHDALPEARVTLLASVGGATAAPLLDGIAEVITHASVWQQLLPGRVAPADERRLIDLLRARRFDAALVFTSFSQAAFPAAYACFLAEIPVRVGHATLFGGQLFSHEVPAPPPSLHQAERAIHLVRALGIPVPDPRLRVRMSDEAARDASALLTAHGLSDAPYVVLAPGASAAARRYPAGRFAEAAREVHARTGAAVLVVGSEQEVPLVEAVAGLSPGVISLAGQTSLPIAAALIARARGVIANNSLAMHLADALCVPVVVTYAGTDPVERWAPRFTTSRVLTQPTDCSPCYHIDCPRALECLDLPPSAIADAIVEVAGRTPQAVA